MEEMFPLKINIVHVQLKIYKCSFSYTFMKYPMELQGSLLTINIKSKMTLNVPNWKRDDLNFINY